MTETTWNASFFRQEALEAFRSGPGAAKSALLEENRSRLKISKRRAKDLGLSINGTKRELDTLKQKAEDLKSQRQSQTGEGAGQVRATVGVDCFNAQTLREDHSPS